MGCLRCGNCCTRFGVCVTPFDIYRIAKATGREPVKFVSAIDDYENRERKEPAVLIDGKPMLVVLKRDAKNICMFYSGTGCTIYENRPMLCRCYPFIAGKAGLAGLKSRACPKAWKPGGKEKKEYSQHAAWYEKEVAACRKIAERWNKKGGGTLRGFLDFALRDAGISASSF